ncbi:MAG: NUDIX domain-containing protein [Acidimicrobiia bacterium]
MTTRRRRDSARVIVVDDTGSVLLFRIIDPIDPGPPMWITPGGGTETGESLVETARRELREETGIEGLDEAVLPAQLAELVRTIERGDLPDAPLELPWITV